MRNLAARDRGLARITQGTRVLAVGSILGGGVIAATLANQIPGRSPNSKPASSSTAGSGSSATGASGGYNSGLYASGDDGSYAAGSGSNYVAPPVQVPQQTYSAPVVSSGAS